MSSYFIAQIKIHDSQEYEKYLQGTDAVFSKYRGKYLAVDCNPERLEGEWKHDRIVVIEFPNDEELKRWYNSDDYKAILKYRLNAAECDTIIAHGLKE